MGIKFELGRRVSLIAGGIDSEELLMCLARADSLRGSKLAQISLVVASSVAIATISRIEIISAVKVIVAIVIIATIDFHFNH